MFIEIIKSVIYGIVQGITEWLPISSTGHLIIAKEFIPFNLYADAALNTNFFEMYEVVIQLGSIIAVVVLFFKDLWPWGFGKTKEETMATFRLWFLVIVGSIPVGVIGVLFDDFIDAKLRSILTVAIMLIVYGILFIIIENMNKPSKINSIEELKPMDAVKVGLFETLALIPGTSRSGATIVGSRILGISRKTAAKFSFILALPPMAGASLLKVLKMEAEFNTASLTVTIVGMVVAFIVSLVCIKKLMDYLNKHDFKVFGYYRIVLGIVLIAMYFLK